MRKSYAQSFFNPFVYIYNEVQRWLRKTLYNNEAIYFRQNVTLFINSSRQRVLDFTGKSCRSFNNNLHTKQHRVITDILMNRNNGLDENAIFYFFLFYLKIREDYQHVHNTFHSLLKLEILQNYFSFSKS